MTSDKFSFRVGSLLPVFVLLVGCSQPQAPAPAAVQDSSAPATAVGWEPALPSSLSSLTVKDGGACFLDAINGAAIPPGPIRLKAGTPVGLAGWAAADLKAGKVGSALAVQLHSANPYFALAEGYARPGLGAALKNPALDAGGLRLNPLPLNPPAGDYRVLFLMQSGTDLLRCDTGRNIEIQ